MHCHTWVLVEFPIGGPKVPSVRAAQRRRLARLDLFLVCAVASVLGNRVFLIITGYPQLGNGTLHISHAIWGALMMAIAIIFAISFLAPSTRTFIAFLGGSGFGWFIDELGKFITRDVNYFFEPTIALIYIVFIVMYLVFRIGGERERSRPTKRCSTASRRSSRRRSASSTTTHRRGPSRSSTRPAPNDPLARRGAALLLDGPRCRRTTPAGSAVPADRLRTRYLELDATRRSFVVVVDACCC